MVPSSSRRVLPIVVAFLCILGVGMAAATLSTANPIGASDNDQIFNPPDPGPGVDDIDSEGADRNQSGDVQSGGDGNAMEFTTCVEPLSSTAGAFSVAGAFLLVLMLAFYRSNFATTLLVSWALLPPVMLVYFLLTDCTGGESSVPNMGGGGTDAAGETVAPVGLLPPWVLAVLIGAVFVGAVGLLYRSMSEEEVVVLDEDDDDDEPDIDQFAEAAGRAADRIEKRNSSVDNSVYRAWIEMTSLLDVERPDTYSAGEFAKAAIGVGMAEEDVSEMTELFNEVRYGGKDATTREDRAVTILRNIESQYGSNEEDETDSNGQKEKGQ